ncbi:Mesaconyl-C(4)-CoA hydratase [Smittium culicis]|uniref:Mesaconyl-C(4)-CoA hydratase n=1 Tax=Smittium culicis TaxID=133412 RepID=A0A1R1WYJ5_9FUNG|nr:Mesaconyl-C(4)-CoA hydratase [Smittium culicis]
MNLTTSWLKSTSILKRSAFSAKNSLRIPHAIRNRASLLSTSSILRADKTNQSVEEWAAQAKSSSSSFNEIIDGRRLAHLRNTLAPHMPQAYPQLKLDAKTKEAASGEELFPNSHLVYFWLLNPENELSRDGYFSGEAPPAPYLQRVWAGGELEFNTSNPLCVGQDASLTMKIDSVTEKQRSPEAGGPIILVSMSRTAENNNGFSLKETRNLAYMEKTNPSRKIIKSSRLTVSNSHFNHTFTPTEILLFRYSALTWNSHRIHYDFNYSNKIEKHPNNLVHGPLTCTMLLELLRTNSPNGYKLRNFKYRAVSPLYSNQPLTLCGTWSKDSGTSEKTGENELVCELFALNNEGGVAMSGKATLTKV